MQAGLDLHPLTVVVALTFWGSIWGIAGMILSVPITCGIRLALQEIDDPFARWCFDVLDRPLGRHKASKEPPLSPDSSQSGHSNTD